MIDGLTNFTKQTRSSFVSCLQFSQPSLRIFKSYNSDLIPVEKIAWELYTHLDYFVVKSPSSPSAELEIEDEENLKAFVSAAKAHKTTISLTIGGWTGSVYFSSLVATEESRQAFASSISKLVSRFKFDGVDLDWEYPNLSGQDGNQISPLDSENLLKFLSVLRHQLGPRSRLSAAVSVHGFMGPSGEYLKDHAPYAKFLDFITIMAYDLYGPTSTPLFGPNAPLFETCNDPETKFSVSQAIQAWTSTGFPASQILLGIPSYGYQYQLESSSLNPTHFSGQPNLTSLFFGKIDKSKQAQGLKTGPVSPGSCGSPTDDGNFLFKDLITCGFLSQDGLTGLRGFQRHYDHCTHTVSFQQVFLQNPISSYIYLINGSTDLLFTSFHTSFLQPFLFNPSNQVLIAYDDPASLAEKTKFARSKGLAGVNVFDAAGDTASNLLMKSVNKAMYDPLWDSLVVG